MLEAPSVLLPTKRGTMAAAVGAAAAAVVVSDRHGWGQSRTAGTTKLPSTIWVAGVAAAQGGESGKLSVAGMAAVEVEGLAQDLERQELVSEAGTEVVSAFACTGTNSHCGFRTSLGSKA